MSKLASSSEREKRDLYQDVTDRMIAALESGSVPWQKPWRGGGKNAPRNAITGKPYRGINIWILSWEKMLRQFNSNRWLTFNQAMKAKAKFKGEKGDAIRKSVEVVLWKPIVKPVLDANGQPVLVNGKPKISTFLFLRSFRVFNEDQFEPFLKPEPEVEAFEAIDEAEKIAHEYFLTGPRLEYGFDHACYWPSADRIEMPSREQFAKPDEFYSTLFHEMTHSTLHEKRLNRKQETEAGSHPFGSKHYSQEELVAEMGASFLCAVTGIENTFENSAAYVANWLKVLKEDNRAILLAAARAQKACDFILGTTFEETKETEDDEA